MLIDNQLYKEVLKQSNYYKQHNDTDKKELDRLFNINYLIKFSKRWEEYNQINFSTPFNKYSNIIEQLRDNINCDIDIPEIEDLEDQKFNKIYKNILDFLISIIQLSSDPSNNSDRIMGIFNDLKKILIDLEKIIQKDNDLVKKLSYYEVKIVCFAIKFRFENDIESDEFTSINFDKETIEEFYEEFKEFIQFIENAIKDEIIKKDINLDKIAAIIKTIKSRSSLLNSLDQLFGTTEQP